MGELDPERAGQRLADAAAARAEVIAGALELDGPGQVGPGGDRLVDHDGVGGSAASSSAMNRGTAIGDCSQRLAARAR